MLAGNSAFLLLTLILSPLASASRRITVKNNCGYTLWPAIFTSPGSIAPDFATGWELKSKATTTIDVDEKWAGRIWPRTECDFSNPQTADMPFSCLTGGCNGGLQCARVGGTGVPPATLAEFAFGAGGAADWFDISLVDGFSVPADIANDVNCAKPSCTANINAACPEELQVLDARGKKVIGCRTSCSAGLWNGPGGNGNSPYCCSGDYDTPETCPASGVLHRDVFKTACPTAYSFAYDEKYGQSPLYTCPTDRRASFTVTFCPSTARAPK